MQDEGPGSVLPMVAIPQKLRIVMYVGLYRIHHMYSVMDFVQKGGRNFLVIIDNYSKWLEVPETKNTSSESTCDALRTLFALFGVPEEVV